MRIIPSSMQAIIRNSFSTVIVRGTFGFARILVLMALAKTYGPEEFGLFSLILIFIEISKVVSDFGVDIVSIRRFASSAEHAHSVLESILGLKFLAAIMGSILTVGVYLLLYGTSAGLLLLVLGCISIFTSLTLNAFVSYYQAQLSMSKIMMAHLMGYGSYLAISLFMIFQHTHLAFLMVVIPFSEGIIVFLLVRRSLQHQPLHIHIDYSFLRSIVSESIYVGLGGIAVVIYMRLDNVMISRLLDLRSVGHYALAYRLIEPFSLLFSSFGISLYASLSALSKDVKIYERFFYERRYLILMLVVAGLGVAGYIFLVRPLLPLFSPEYLESGNVLLLLSFVLLFKAVNTQLTAILNSIKKFRIVSIITCINLCVSILLYFIFIPRYGIQGAALAAVGTEFLNSLLQISTVMYYHRKGQ